MGTDQSKPQFEATGGTTGGGGGSLRGFRSHANLTTSSSLTSSTTSSSSAAQRFRRSTNTTPNNNHASEESLPHLILTQNWAAVRERLRHFSREASMVIPMKIHNVDRRILPLHLACACNPPLDIIQKLVQMDEGTLGVPVKNIVRSGTTRTGGGKKKRNSSAAAARRRSSGGTSTSGGTGSRARRNSNTSSTTTSSSNNAATQLASSMLQRNTWYHEVPSRHNSARSFVSQSEGGAAKAAVKASTSSTESGFPAPPSFRHGSTRQTVLAGSSGGTTGGGGSNNSSRRSLLRRVGSSSRSNQSLQQMQLLSLWSRPSADANSDGWLPVHIAVLYDAEPTVVEYLLVKFPLGAKAKNGMGMLPLHIVTSKLVPPGGGGVRGGGSVEERNVDNNTNNGGGGGGVEDHSLNNPSGTTSTDIVELLLRAFPESVHVPSSNADAMTPLEYVEAYYEEGSTEKEDVVKLLEGNVSRMVPLDERNSSFNQNSSVEEGEESSNGSTSDGGSGGTRAKRKTTRETSVHSFLPGSNSVITKSNRHSSASSSIAASFRLLSLRSSTSRVRELDPNKPTKLYLHVSHRDWDSAMKRLHKCPMEASVWTLMDVTVASEDAMNNARRRGSSGSIAGSSFAEIRHSGRGGGEYACHRLPLHRACALKPPVTIICALNDAYPDGITSREKFGMLPLHVACQNGAALEVIRTLLKSYPTAAMVHDAFGLLPLHLACTEGASVGVVTALLKAYPEGADAVDKKGNTPIDFVQDGFHPNRTNVLKLLRRDVGYWSARKSEEAPPLHQLVKKRKWTEATERLVEHPEEASIWVLDDRRDGECPRLPIHVAAARKPTPAVLQSLANAYPKGVETTELHGALPLHVACQRGASPEAVSVLLDAFRDGAAVSDEFGLLPVHVACTEGAAVGVVEALLEANPTSATIKDHKGYDAIHYARGSFHPNRAAVLEVLQRDPSSWTTQAVTNGEKKGKEEASEVTVTLHELIDRKEWQLIPHLLEVRPDEASQKVRESKQQPKDGTIDPTIATTTTPLHKVCTMTPPSTVVKSLIEAYPEGVQTTNDQNELPLHVACSHHASVEVIETLLSSYQMGAATRDNRGRLPVHVACIDGTTPAIVQTLLGACPDSAQSKDTANLTPIEYAIRSYHPNKALIIDVLERNAATTNASTTLYHLISSKRWIDAVTRAREHPGEAAVWNMDAGYDHGRLALHRACALCPPRRVVAALHNAYPGGVSTKEKDGKYPLHVACQNGASLEVVQLLINVYPNAVSIRDQFGLLPIHVACSEGAHLEVIKVLLRAAPGSFAAKDSRGWTALEYAELTHPSHPAIVAEVTTQQRASAGDTDATPANPQSGSDRRTFMEPSRSVPSKLSVDRPDLVLQEGDKEELEVVVGKRRTVDGSTSSRGDDYVNDAGGSTTRMGGGRQKSLQATRKLSKSARVLTTARSSAKKNNDAGITIACDGAASHGTLSEK